MSTNRNVVAREMLDDLDLAFPTFQIDLAFDSSELADTGAVSVIWQF